MGAFIDQVPLSGIIRIREMMAKVENPFRLDQGDVSFDAPEAFKEGMIKGLRDGQTHYMLTAGAPRLRELCAQRMREKHGIPIDDPNEVLVTNGGLHALYVITQCMLEPGDEVLINDPTWPPFLALVLLARAKPVICPLYEKLGWRYDLDELRSKITPRTKMIYINSPQNPTGGVLERSDLEAIAAIAQERNLTVISDEAYEDYVFDGAEHVSIASLPGMYERTYPIYTFSKAFAVTGLRLGYVAVKDPDLRKRVMKMMFYTTSNVCSATQYGGIAMLESDTQKVIDEFVGECKIRRDLWYSGMKEAAPTAFSGEPPKGGMFAFMKIGSAFDPPKGESLSWAMTEHLISKARIGNVPGVDFSPNPGGANPAGEGYIRFCFARERPELTGALKCMAELFGGKAPAL